MQLQLLTCARIGEVMGAEWSEIDLDAQTWLQPAAKTKNGDAHLVMLPTQAVALLRAAEEAQKDNPSPLVFPQLRDRKKPVSTARVQEALINAREEHGINPEFTTHIIRKACLTWLAEQGCNEDLRNRVSNHRPSNPIDAIYTAASLNGPAREWIQKWADHLDGLAGGNVVELSERKAGERKAGEVVG
ncbi:tyrosine-type recombinase/integrase [Lutimaribacter marinistellae]|uniref:Tyrosine-type recombinase/integrase n=1 Tax=Lutimaribacter marinistellae TaxID=1820329 RepID=A0ABV7TMM7_9RHOB